MKNTRHDIQAASAMLERARQILELTYHDWRLHERHQRRGKGRVVKKQGRHASCDRPVGFVGTPAPQRVRLKAAFVPG